MSDLIISTEQAGKIATYLGSRPWCEVMQLMQILLSLKPIPEQPAQQQ